MKLNKIVRSVCAVALFFSGYAMAQSEGGTVSFHGVVLNDSHKALHKCRADAMNYGTEQICEDLSGNDIHSYVKHTYNSKMDMMVRHVALVYK